jgi:hypothetical protein
VYEKGLTIPQSISLQRPDRSAASMRLLYGALFASACNLLYHINPHWLMRDNDLVECFCCIVSDKWYMIRIDVVRHDEWEMTWLIGKN